MADKVKQELLLTPEEKCGFCKGHGKYHLFQAEDNIETKTCPVCNGTGKAQLAKVLRDRVREKIAKTPVETHKYNGKRYLTLNGIDQILALFPDEEEIRKDERERIEKQFIWGQVKIIDLEKGEVEWTMRCISDKDWQALKWEARK